jgi:hypothetical protein
MKLNQSKTLSAWSTLNKEGSGNPIKHVGKLP